MAKDITIQVWAGGSNVNDSYRVDAISMAADILEKEAAILGEDLNITVETKYDFVLLLKQSMISTVGAASNKR